MREVNTIERIEARFRSENSVPVERASITADEWVAIRAMAQTLRNICKAESSPGHECVTLVVVKGYAAQALSKLEGE